MTPTSQVSFFTVLAGLEILGLVIYSFWIPNIRTGSSEPFLMPPMRVRMDKPAIKLHQTINSSHIARFITIKKTGRLGNNLFQLASLQGIAKVNKLNIAFPRKLIYLFEIFNLNKSLKTIMEADSKTEPVKEVKKSEPKEIKEAKSEKKPKTEAKKEKDE